MSWLKNNLNLSWIAAEKHPALAEIRFRRDEQPTESWEKVRQIVLPYLSEAVFLH